MTDIEVDPKSTRQLVALPGACLGACVTKQISGKAPEAKVDILVLTNCSVLCEEYFANQERPSAC